VLPEFGGHRWTDGQSVRVALRDGQDYLL